jgi:hypothetical protein
VPLPGTSIQTLQSAAAANGNGTPAQTDGLDAAQQVEIVETNGGTCTVTFEGSFDGKFTNVYAIGYYQVDGTATLTRTVTGVSVTANSAHVYQLLDPYPQVRARISSVASTPSVTVRMYGIAT